MTMKIRLVEDMVIDGRMRRAGEVVETDQETVKLLIHSHKAVVVTGLDLTPRRRRVKRAGIEAETAAMEAPEER